jgi:hypothetical protein
MMRTQASTKSTSEAHVFEDSYVEIMKMTPDGLKMHLTIDFDGTMKF